MIAVNVGPLGVRAGHFGRMSSRSVAFRKQETAKVKIYESNLCEGEILKTRSIPLGHVPHRLGDSASGTCPNAAGARHSSICRADHHGGGRHALSGAMHHQFDADKRVVAADQPYAGEQSAVMGGHDLPGHAPALLPGPVRSATDKQGVHPRRPVRHGSSTDGGLEP